MSNKIQKNMGREYYKLSATPQNPDGYVSKSLLWQVFRESSPFKWKNGKTKKDITPATAFGSLVHTMAFQPDLFREEYAISEWDSFRTKAAQEWRDEQVAAGKTVVTEEQRRAAEDMSAIIADEIGLAIPGPCDYEVAVLSSLAHRVKGMIDIVPQDQPCLADLKTTSAIPDEKGMVNLLLNRGYHWQAAMYLDLWNAATGDDRQDFHFLFIETEAPYETAWVKISEKMLDAGRMEYQHALMQWHQCVSTGIWPKKIQGQFVADLPAWYQ